MERLSRILAILVLMLAVLGALHLHWIVTIALIGFAILLAVVRPEWMIAAVAASIPLQESVLLQDFRGDLTYTQIAIGALILGWGALFWRRRIWLDSIVVGFLLVFAAFIFSMQETDSPGLWFGEVYRWGTAGLFYVICRSELTSFRKLVPSLWAVTLGVIAISVHALQQGFFGEGPEHFLAGGAMRVYGWFGTPNTLAAYLEFCVPLLAVLCLFGIDRSIRDRIGTWLWLAMGMASVIGTLVLGLTQSRGGWVGFAVALVVLFMVIPRRLKLVGAGVALLLIVGVLLTAPGRSQLDRFSMLWEGPEGEHIAANQVDYALGRTSLWLAAVSMIEDKPLTGVGAGEYDDAYRDHVPRWYDRMPKGQAHNGWLQMGAQAGIPGMIAFSVWIGMSIWSLFRAARETTDRLHAGVVWGAFAIMMGFLVHNLVDYLNVLSLGLQLSLVTAAALNLAPRPLSRYSDIRSQSTDAESIRVSPAGAV